MHAQKNKRNPICHTHTVWLWFSGKTPGSPLWVNCNKADFWFHCMKQFGDTDLESVVQPWHPLVIAFLYLFLVKFCLCVHVRQSTWGDGVFNERLSTLFPDSLFLLFSSFCNSITLSVSEKGPSIHQSHLTLHLSPFSVVLYCDDDFHLHAILMFRIIFPSTLPINVLPIHLFIPPHPHYIYREEECEDEIEEEEEEETPVTESDSDEQEGAVTVSKQNTPRYFRTWT